MSGTVEYDLTANYGLKKPWDDADDDVWGLHLNENMDLIDNLLVTRGFDASKYLPLTGGTITGSLTIDGELTTGGDAFIGGKLWAEGDATVTGTLTADGVLNVDGALNAYGALNAHGALTASSTLDVGGVATFNNTVNLANAPVAPGQAANKGYVDGAVSAAVGAYLPLAGGEVTGNLQVDGALNVGTVGGAGFKLDVAGSLRTSGPLTVGLDTSTAAGAALFVNGAAGVQRQFIFRTASLGRWLIMADSSAESGANAGSNLTIGTYTDAGVYNGPVLVANRATKIVTISGSLNNTTLGQDTGITAQFILNSPAGLGKQLYFRSASSNRWVIQSDTAAESGSNAGSNFSIYRYDDTGANLGAALSVTRSTGATTIPGALTLSGGGAFTGTFSGTHTYSGAVTFSGSATVAGALNATGGLSFGSTQAGSVTDLSKQIALYGTTYGFSITGGRLNIVSPASSAVMVNIGGTDVATFNTSGIAANTGTQAVGENTLIANTQFVAKNAGGYQTAAIADADTAFTAAQMNVRIVAVTGALTAERTITVPTANSQKNWIVRNQTTGGFNINVTTGSGAIFSIPPNLQMEFWTNTVGLFPTQIMFAGGTLRFGDAKANALQITPGATSTSTTTLNIAGTGLLQIASATQFATAGFNGTAPIVRPTVNGAWAGNTAGKALCTALASYGLITDGTTA